MKLHPFSEVVTDATSKFTKIKTSEYQTQGRYKIIDQGKEPIAGYTDDASLVNNQLLPVLIFGDHTRSLKYADTPIALGADGAKALWVDPALADTRYVYYYLRSIQIKEAGYSRHFKFLKEVDIPIPFKDGSPDFAYQIRIVHLLGKVEELITQRKHHLQQLDDLLKSVFLEMFGDPVRNEKGWDKIPFSKLLADIESGKSPKCEARQAESNEWGVLKLGAVTRCKFDETENKALPNDVIPSTRDEVKAGDLLFSRKNTYELVAACAYVFSTRPKLLMPDLIFRFIFKQDVDINPIFMWKLLTCDSQRKAIQSLAAGAAGSMPNISKTNLKSVRLPKPPLSLQNQFATIVEKVESIKSRYQQSLADLEVLYSSLSQRAFKGELDLSRVPLPDQPVAAVTIADHATSPKWLFRQSLQFTCLPLTTCQPRWKMPKRARH
ncbi:Restriction endonuclease S subunits-like protein [Dickeya chrysanthemi Ech1591]|uniref:Restriction endonuclease S subunits-like protein n=1 Tax=Dickeya chrysanthemi (strain Ech1591) TaxID=561229 RepID=C6CR15_DICC1|nr:restriction endonuclease subunit S [Dickeya chrysanthemi]ACT09032.1 Restriction endonuclease S subunits-like protein [Dickeya chrysanthemi Ech1591]